MNEVKTFANSYLYTKIPNYERNILEYVMKAERIDKRSQQFMGIIEDVKRRQTSAVLSRVLMRDDVVLSFYNKGLPASFKVFTCKDVKTDRSLKVFIDCSGLISEKNGYYVCNKIDVLCTYLLSAMTNIVYYNDPMRITNNSTVIQSGTECFVALASHIFDYLRLGGYSENRNKIAYILAMYFQVSILGLSREDMSVKNLAAKVSGIERRDINTIEIYYSDEDLLNINTIITSISNTFKLKGMGTDIFVEKWNWIYGAGCQFGCELFPSFSEIITNAYCGSYINNQRQIEGACGRTIVTYTNAIMRVGSETIDSGFRYESALDRDMYDRHTKSVLQEKLFMKKVEKDLKPTTDDYISNDSNLSKKIKTILSDNEFSDKQKSGFVKSYFMEAMALTDYYLTGKKKGYPNTASTIIKLGSKYLSEKDKQYVTGYCSRVIVNCTKKAAEGDKMFTSSDAKKILADAKTCMKILDSQNPVLKESSELAAGLYISEETILQEMKFTKRDLTDPKIVEKTLRTGFDSDLKGAAYCIAVLGAIVLTVGVTITFTVALALSVVVLRAFWKFLGGLNGMAKKANMKKLNTKLNQLKKKCEKELKKNPNDKDAKKMLTAVEANLKKIETSSKSVSESFMTE